MTEFQTGLPYRFIVTNEGLVNHEFMIMPPLSEPMGMHMDMEQMDEMALGMIEADDLAPGSTRTIEITFTGPSPADMFEFACHTENHYEEGMKLPITVK